jgi:catechol 2,3-dioxygenase-like lactoylglutathione lyase family enzyme
MPCWRPLSPRPAAVSADPVPAAGGLDHTAFAVRDALACAARLRHTLGAVPVAGEVLPEFRYLLLYIGDADRGAMLELLEPTGDGFLTRHLHRRGESPHHITFAVPDLRDTVARVRSLGLSVTGESYEHPAWREAFISPDGVHGTVIQLAQSDRRYPPAAELLATRDRHPDTMPSSSGATDRAWWTSVWSTPVANHGRLGATRLRSTDLSASRRLFADVLGGAVSDDGTGAGVVLRWPVGALHVLAADRPGIAGVDGLPAS